jgi:phytoene dehydrogenase-like protein
VSAGTTVVIGAGPNGLAAAVALAREGHEVVVLEARATVGGLCAGDEFHPGYRHTGVHHDAERVPPFVRVATELDRHGLVLRAPPPVFVPGAGAPAALPALPARARSVIASALDEPVPALGPDAPLWPLVQRAFAARRLGADVLTELLRVGVLAAEDWTAEWEPDLRWRAAHALPALLGAYMGPRSPHSAGLLLIGAALGGSEVAGGPAALVDALTRACAAWRVELRTGARVRRILVGDRWVRGVELDSGEEIAARAVVSTVDPKRTLLDLLDPSVLPGSVEDEARRIRTRVTSAKVHLAWSAFPAFTGGAPPAERYRVVDDPRSLERAFDDAKHGRFPRSPALDVRIPTLSRADLAPAGHHVASVHVFGAPGALEGGWTDERKRALLDLVLGRLATHQPDVRAVTVGAEVLVGPDLDARFGTTGGHLHHGETALDTLWVGRPGALLCRHTTPVGGLYLGSGGIHPGVPASGASGVLAARAVAEGR